MRINLALSGGGIKGIAHLGGLKALEENNVEVVALAGSSVGAMIASLYGAGYSVSALKELIYQQNFSEFKDGFLFNLYRLIFSYGVYRGQSILEWLSARLEDKGVKKFSDLSFDVRIVVSDINSSTAKIFSPHKTPDYSVAKAVRMSLSIPVLYQPCFYQRRFCVDGGVINNLPLTIFADSNLPTLGFLIMNSGNKSEREIDNLLDYLGVIIDTSISINELRQIELSRSKVISIPTPGISSINFNLSQSKKKELYNCGYQEVYQNLDKFMDRRGVRSNNRFCDISPTIVEIEEVSTLMLNYIVEEIEVDGISTIIALEEDDYLFSFLVAQKLNKKFTVIDLNKYHMTYHKSDYRYNQLQPNSRVLVVNYSLKQNKKLDKLIARLRAQNIEVAAVFNFFAVQRESGFRFRQVEVPIYTYN